MKHLYCLRLIWPDGVTATPLRGLSKEDAEEYVAALQPKYDKIGQGTKIVIHPEAVE